MRKSFAALLIVLGMIPILPGRGNAETRTVFWSAVTAYTDGTPIEPTRVITYDFFWTTDAGLSPASLRTVVSSVSQTSATFDPEVVGMPRGQTVYFTGEAVLNTGEKSALAPPYSWTVPVVSPPPPRTLLSLAISGPASVNEGGSGSYTATATWSDGSTTGVTPSWSVTPTTYASIAPSGVLTTLSVTSNQSATVNASYATGGVTRTASRAVTIVNVAATLFSLAISGPASVNEGGSGSYTATATWSDGSTTSVAPTWSENSTYASISTGGVLTTTAVTADESVTVSGSYTSGGVTRNTTKTVTIVDIPPGTLAPVQNVAVNGPVATSPARIFRLRWDPVVTYADGTPIPSGSARYTAYWTADPSLSAGTLRPLVSSFTGTSVDFDPAAAGMVVDQRVYFTVIVTAGSGGQSPLSAGVTWVTLNPGPAAPSGGTIIRR